MDESAEPLGGPPTWNPRKADFVWDLWVEWAEGRVVIRRELGPLPTEVRGTEAGVTKMSWEGATGTMFRGISCP